MRAGDVKTFNDVEKGTSLTEPTKKVSLALGADRCRHLIAVCTFYNYQQFTHAMSWQHPFKDAHQRPGIPFQVSCIDIHCCTIVHLAHTVEDAMLAGMSHSELFEL